MHKQDNLIYPIVFSSVAVERMWGGDFIKNFLKQQNTNINFNVNNKIGELWLLSDRKDEQSIVESGALKGLTINELWCKYSKVLFGIDNSNQSTFPLLIKLIDADDDLSLQVHPKEEDLAYLENSEAKTEMWYVVDCKSNAEILAGFNDTYIKQEDNNLSNNTSVINKESFIGALNNTTELKKMVKCFSAEKGKYFFIPAGTIHAIGKGNLIFEIQQNSDTTYRVSDWGRVDSTGNSRKLHIEESIKCINFSNEVVYNGKKELNN